MNHGMMQGQGPMIYGASSYHGHPAPHASGQAGGPHALAQGPAASPFVRMLVSNVPSYMKGEEFRGQFQNCEGVVRAVIEKDDSG